MKMMVLEAAQALPRLEGRPVTIPANAVITVDDCILRQSSIPMNIISVIWQDKELLAMTAEVRQKAVPIISVRGVGREKSPAAIAYS